MDRDGADKTERPLFFRPQPLIEPALILREYRFHPLQGISSSQNFMNACLGSTGKVLIYPKAIFCQGKIGSSCNHSVTGGYGLSEKRVNLSPKDRYGRAVREEKKAWDWGDLLGTEGGRDPGGYLSPVHPRPV